MPGRIRIDLRNGVIEADMGVAAVEPPARDLLPVAVRPFLDDLAPFPGEFQVDRLVAGLGTDPERLLGASIVVGGLAGQVEHQLDAPGRQRPVQIQGQVAGRTSLAGGVAGDPLIDGIGRIEVARVLPQGDHEVLRAGVFELGRDLLHIEGLHLLELPRSCPAGNA